MQDLLERINKALAHEEERAERFANIVRLILLLILTIIAALNASSVSLDASLLNFGVLAVGYVYGFAVFVRLRRSRYHRFMKYATSCLDVTLVFFLLAMYSRIEIPSVALKNYAFLVVFPLIALTAFRYDRLLTVTAGGLAIGLYIVMIVYLYLKNAIVITNGGYADELFTDRVTVVGQLTKVLILSGYVLLLSYFAQYSRRLFAKLITNELSLRNQKEAMDWELKIASQVQSQFLPRSFPEIAGLELYGIVQHGRFVGGDYFDFIQLGGGKLLIVTADVSGKGVPASLIMAEVRASMQLLTSMEIHLQILTERLNSMIHQSTDKKNFVTMFVGQLELSKRTLTYVNAGHPPPLICSSKKIWPLARGTLPLGVSQTLPNLVTHVVEFHPGDLLVSYTDGIIERTNVNGEHFGEERLIEYVQRNADVELRVFTQRLIDEVRDFGQGKDFEDDVTLAVVRHDRFWRHENL